MYNDSSTVMSLRHTFEMKSSLICVAILLNVSFSSLVIALMYKFRRTMFKDRTMIFMLSMAMSDLVGAMIFMPLSAIACSNFTPDFRNTHGAWPIVNMVGCWWWGYCSLHSLAWISVTKAMSVLWPLHFERLWTKIRCTGVCVAIWTSALLLATIRVYVRGDQSLYGWNMQICMFRTPRTVHSKGVDYFRWFALVVTDVLPVLVMVLATGLIVAVVMRTHFQIAKQRSALMSKSSNHGYIGLATLKTIKSSRNILIIVSISFLMQIPLVSLITATSMGGYKVTLNKQFFFSVFWLFHTSGMVNSFLFLVLYATVRKQITAMLAPLLCFRWCCVLDKPLSKHSKRSSNTSDDRNTSSLQTCSTSDHRVSLSTMSSSSGDIDRVHYDFSFKVAPPTCSFLISKRAKNENNYRQTIEPKSNECAIYSDAFSYLEMNRIEYRSDFKNDRNTNSHSDDIPDDIYINSMNTLNDNISFSPSELLQYSPARRSIDSNSELDPVTFSVHM